MLSKDQIRDNLKKDPYWELPDEASNQEWQWFDEIYEELEESGELNFGSSSEGSSESGGESYFSGSDDDDDDWGYDD